VILRLSRAPLIVQMNSMPMFNRAHSTAGVSANKVFDAWLKMQNERLADDR
jgi:hypothetical protein